MPTTRTVLTPNTWSDLGTTPCYIQSPSPETVFYVIDTAAPSAVSDISTVPAHQLRSDGDDLADVNVSLSGQRVFARGNGPVIVSR